MFGLFNHFHNTVIKMTIITHDVIPVCQIEESSGKSSISSDAHLAPMMSFFARSIPAMTLTLSTLVSCCQKKKRIISNIEKQCKLQTFQFINLCFLMARILIKEGRK